MRRADGVFSARSGQLLASGDGAVQVRLRDGVGVWRQADGTLRRMHFGAMRFEGDLPGIAFAGEGLRERLDRLPLRALLDRIRTGPAEERGPARAALAARWESALFCLLLPCFGLVLGVPARRRGSAVGLALAVGVVVAHLNTAALVESRFAAHALVATAVHFTAWVLLALAALAAERKLGEGFVESWGGRLAAVVLERGTRRSLAVQR
ncbi:MAG: LptF/LptG family permease [Acetobacteraceae bacterium]|nr:LptF/LptG family permease [Acetobacteraceae bacterium]